MNRCNCDVVTVAVTYDFEEVLVATGSLTRALLVVIDAQLEREVLLRQLLNLLQNQTTPLTSLRQDLTCNCMVIPTAHIMEWLAAGARQNTNTPQTNEKDRQVHVLTGEGRDVTRTDLFVVFQRARANGRQLS